MKMYYFGCIGQAGHFLWDMGIGKWPDVKLPWYPIDAALTPEDVPGEERQPQGRTAMHQKDGWSAMAWWDRSGPDTRYGCNSVLFVEGEHDFDQMRVLLKEYWRQIHDRQPVELFL